MAKSIYLTEYLKTAKGILLRLLSTPMWMMLLASLCLTSLIFWNKSVWDLPVAIINLDQTPTSFEVIRQINSSPKIKLHHYDTLSKAQLDLHSRKQFAIIIIPQNFEKNLLRGQNTIVPIYGDATNRLANGQIQQAITDVYQQLADTYNKQLLYKQGYSENQAEVLLHPIKSIRTDLYNPGINFAAITMPGLLIMLLQQSLLMASTRTSIALYIAHNGKTPLHIHLGAMTGLLPIWLFLTITLLVFWPAIMGFRQTASIPELLILAIPFLFAVMAMGKFVMQCLRNVELIYLTLTFIPTPVFYFSGAIWPASSMPDFIWYLSRLLPSTWATKMLAGTNQLGLSIWAVWPDILILMLLTLVYSLLAFIVGWLRDYGFKRFSWRKI